ncbi:MAG: adenosylmethionine--8-amino-7-oxononanoate transaminase [Candidatus Omnitrophica bacterium]|nr:adenosylmethionine--8-amino-7-oxononanoate transaminase [Candidatus Omnitrophota bacterium]
MNNLIKKDLAYNWHPYTQMKDCETMPPIPIKNAHGAKLYDHEGNFYYDTISSWWCNIHGHTNPKIIRAITEQATKLEHTLFAGFTHEPAVMLSEKLIQITPDGLDKVFYSDNGSTAVEVALKMSLQYWQNIGITDKKHFVSFDRGYHGDTAGAMSVSGKSIYNDKFKPIMTDHFQVLTPYCYRCPLELEQKSCSIGCMTLMENILRKNSSSISAIIIEPLLLGAGGMIIYPHEYLKKVYDLAKKYNVHLIFDEVATGFGRTGKMFAFEHASIVPDFLCLSKGITSGYLPLSVTMTSNEIYNSFYGDYDEYKTFYHGHTYTANPIACAAALASIEIFETEQTLYNVELINNKLNSFLDKTKDLDFVGDIRSIGCVGAIEIVENKLTKNTHDPKKRIGLKIYNESLKQNLILRPMGNVMYFFLPLCLSIEELDDIFDKAGKVINNRLML